MQLFHGTKANITGGKILPGKDHGYSNWKRAGEEYGEPSENSAYASHDEDVAWTFARIAKQEGRGRVYSVAPHPEMRKGAFHDDIGEYIAPHFTVTSSRDIMPGRQGTLPLNWSQFAKEGSDDSHRWRLNHPLNEDVAYGLPGSKRGYTPRLGDNPLPDSLNWNSRHSQQDETIPGIG